LLHPALDGRLVRLKPWIVLDKFWFLAHCASRWRIAGPAGSQILEAVIGIPPLFCFFPFPSEGVRDARLVKVVNHELGHTFGVGHCPAAGCLMQDKRGKVSSVDAESGKPCADCAARLPLAK